MKRELIISVTLLSFLLCVIAGIGELSGALPEWITVALLVIAFPVFAVFTCLWWKAKEGEEDFPFIGY